MRRTKIVFVCLGNACRSQMAEAFARAYGSDVLEPESAGVEPASMIPDVTHKVMKEKGIALTDQFPKSLDETPLHDVDMVVNISGVALRGLPVRNVRQWKVKDPMGARESVHRTVRNDVERLVMSLILELRAAMSKTSIYHQR